MFIRKQILRKNLHFSFKVIANFANWICEDIVYLFITAWQKVLFWKEADIQVKKRWQNTLRAFSYNKLYKNDLMIYISSEWLDPRNEQNMTWKKVQIDQEGNIPNHKNLVKEVERGESKNKLKLNKDFLNWYKKWSLRVFLNPPMRFSPNSWKNLWIWWVSC